MPGLSLLSLGLSLTVLWGTLSGGDCESHSLMYTCTALSKPVEKRGIHEFMAMGRLDSHMIDYFDSDLQVNVPKQSWMKENLKEDYWTKETESRKSKQDWFKVNLKILKERMNQTDQEVHVFQWMRGCEADLLPDGRPSYQRGIDAYSYDGHIILYFDDVHSVWVATAPEWNTQQRMKDNTKGYLKKECLDSLREFIHYSKQELLHKAPPKVYIFASPARQKENVFLTCMATGFYPPDIILTLSRDGYVLDQLDGVTTTGLRPNEDDTYQRRDRIEILRSDRGLFACEAVHAATNVRITEVWDGKLPDDGEQGDLPLGPVLGGLGVLLALVAGLAVGLVLFQKKQQKQREIETRPGSLQPTVKVDVPDLKKEKLPLTNSIDDKTSDNGSDKSSDIVTSGLHRSLHIQELEKEMSL